MKNVSLIYGIVSIIFSSLFLVFAFMQKQITFSLYLVTTLSVTVFIYALININLVSSVSDIIQVNKEENNIGGFNEMKKHLSFVFICFYISSLLIVVSTYLFVVNKSYEYALFLLIALVIQCVSYFKLINLRLKVLTFIEGYYLTYCTFCGSLFKKNKLEKINIDNKENCDHSIYISKCEKCKYQYIEIFNDLDKNEKKEIYAIYDKNCQLDLKNDLMQNKTEYYIYSSNIDYFYNVADDEVKIISEKEFNKYLNK